MKPKAKASAPSPQRSHGGNPFKDRMGLGAYIADPESFPSSRVIYHTPDFVAIRDKFPKATVHTLLLPRSPAQTLRHPFEAFGDDDAAFLAAVRAEVAKLKRLAAAELRRLVGGESRSDARRRAALDGDADPPPGAGEEDGDGLPPGRDWEAEILVGVHAVPSMSHLHIHVLSRDMCSPAMRHRKHYNSFTTPFLVDVADFPLPADDPRRATKEAGYLRRDLRCWRCGRNFGPKFKQLKEHLDEEMEAWRRE
jgi:aprataxin